MDIVSHALIGKIISIPQKSKRATFWTIFFSLLPDVSLTPFYVFLGIINKRPFLIAYNSDWQGARNLYPVLDFIQSMGHSFLFALIIILPIIIIFKLPKIAFWAYIIHLLLDLPTHTEEWGVKPFYPFNYTVYGFTDAWSWPLYIMAISWIVLTAIIILVNRVYKKT